MSIADHPERPTITLGHLSVREAFSKIMCYCLVLWSADQGGIAIEVCSFVPKCRTTPPVPEISCDKTIAVHVMFTSSDRRQLSPNIGWSTLH